MAMSRYINRALMCLDILCILYGKNIYDMRILFASAIRIFTGVPYDVQYRTRSIRPILLSGMPTGSHKKRGTTGRLTRDGELSFPVRSKDPPILSEIISSDLDESQEAIFWCKKRGFPPFSGRLASLYGIPVWHPSTAHSSNKRI